ncbi:MAG: type II toxin-antitoxin system VapC family toxin [Bryobacteraceae bacterium]
MSFEVRIRVVDYAGVLVDSNVLIDVSTNNKVWAEWSEQAIAQLSEYVPLIINPIIYAEVSAGFSTIEELDEALPVQIFRREPLPWEAGFLAAKCFVAYKRRGGQRRSPIPDFYIGAHAAIRGFALLTRDPARYRSYFPRLTIIAPDSEQ